MARAGFSHYQSYTTQKKNREKMGRIIRWFLLVYLSFLILQNAFVTTIRVDNSSMQPTLAPGTAVLASPLPIGGSLPFLPFGFPGWTSPECGQLVALVPPYHQELTGFSGFANDLVKFLTLNFYSLDQTFGKEWDNSLSVRRIIGVPGDRVKVENFMASIISKDQVNWSSEIEQSKIHYQPTFENLPPGWEKDFPLSGQMAEITLGENEYFVMADNRTGANDSRYYGVVKRSHIKSLVMFKYWPMSSFGGF